MSGMGQAIYDDAVKQTIADNVVSLHNVGVPTEKIVEALKLSEEEVLAILAEHKKKE